MLRLQIERQRLGISQRKLAAMGNIDPANLSRIETGKMFSYPGWRKRLAAALGWPVEEADRLFEEVGQDVPQA